MLARFAPEIPDELQRIIRKCLEKNREHRYQSARDLAIDLENIRRQHLAGGQGLSKSQVRYSGETVTLSCATVQKIASGRSISPIPSSSLPRPRNEAFSPDAVTNGVNPRSLGTTSSRIQASTSRSHSAITHEARTVT